ncbi:MAG TPA: ABC transporter ATP-binding protein [Bacilli bacterium]|nr:ABC transporter ATP-binding protein [Bacilli bacterium]HQD92082.1 ABC transporter ATP-binding protein [Bacilli bacterium]
MTYTLFSNFKRMIARIKEKDKSLFGYFILYTIAGAIYPFIGVFLPKVVISELIKDNPNFMRVVIIILIFFAAFATIGFLKHMIESYCYFRIANIRVDYFNDLGMKYYYADFKYMEDPAFLNEFQNTFRTLSNHHEGLEGCLHIIFTSGAAILSIIGYIVLVSNLSWIIFVYLIINVVVNYIVLKAIKKYEYKFKDERSDLNRKINYFRNVSHDFSYGKEIRLYNMGNKILHKYDQEAKKLYKMTNKIQMKDYRMNLITFLVILIREGLVYGYLVYAFVIGKIKIDDFTMYLVAIVSLATAMNNIVNDLSSYVGYNQYVTDLYKFLDRNLISNENNLPIPYDYTYEIEFKNVSFKYPNTDRYILKNFNLKIKRGEKIAIVGVNGAGKTTLVKLLTRLYDIDEGEILINGINIKEFDKQEFYKLFSVVFQEFKMFAMNVKENIALDFENIDEEKVRESLNKVSLSKKIANLPYGLNTSVLKIMDPQGVEFSGGENQKFAIARALYKDAPIIILDEPTASLDALAEQEIYEEFNELVKDKTAIFISHRLASTKFCDRIVLINNSEIEECGTHEELIKNKKYYYEMFMTQAKYYNSNNTEDEMYERN